MTMLLILRAPGLRNETFTTIKITSPQGGNFVTSKVDNLAASS